MKTKFLLLPLITIALTTNSCRKAEEAAVDCFGEAILTSMHFDISTTNPKQVDFTISYSGEKTLTSVEWDFGDGNKTTTTNKTISHTYNTNGTYEVKTNMNLDKGKCTVSPKKSVTVE